MGAKIEPEPPATSPEGSSKDTPHLHLVRHTPNPKLPGKRPLTPAELQMARKVFASGLDYRPILIARMSSFIEVINGSRAYTAGNTIQLPQKAYAHPSQYSSVIIHELVHVWQYQHGGWGYAPKALWCQVFGDGYDFAKALRQDTPWAKMNLEQQGQMIQEAFRAAYFDIPGARFGVLHHQGTVVRPGAQPPEGFSDFTSALVDALALLRKAP